MPPLLLSRSSEVEGPLGTCVKCGQRQMVRGTFAYFRLELLCRACGDKTVRTPPELKKLIVYLDQWVISELANSLDPVLKAKKKGPRDPFWLELYRAIELLVKLHAAVCPQSPIHYQESVVTPYLSALRNLYEHLASGVRFKEPLYIHACQLYDAFDESFSESDPLYEGSEELDEEAEPLPRRSRALDGGVNDWADDIRITARIPLRTGDVAIEEADRQSADKHLRNDSARWRQHRGRSFREWYDYHRRDLTSVVVTCWERGLFGLYAGTCQSMVERAIRAGDARSVAIERVRAFLRGERASERASEYSAVLPYLRTTLRGDVKKGRGRGTEQERGSRPLQRHSCDRGVPTV